MKFKEGDDVVHQVYGFGKVLIAGVNGVCRVYFDSGEIKVVKTEELSGYIIIKTKRDNNDIQKR
jgi:hypothetical protein